MEQWRDVVALEGLYAISNEGRLRNAAGLIMRGDVLKGGYIRFSMSHPALGRVRQSAHRIVMAAFVGPCPKGLEVNHKDGNPGNNRLDNLEYVTRKANHEHSWKVLGRKPPHMGEKTHFAKLTDDDVRHIRRMRGDGHSYKAIAENFNTKPANVWHICQGKTWKHVV